MWKCSLTISILIKSYLSVSARLLSLRDFFMACRCKIFLVRYITRKYLEDSLSRLSLAQFCIDLFGQAVKALSGGAKSPSSKNLLALPVAPKFFFPPDLRCNRRSAFFFILVFLFAHCGLRGTTSLTAWKKVIFVNLKKKSIASNVLKFCRYICA